MRQFTGAIRDRTGNMARCPASIQTTPRRSSGIKPDGRDLTMARWGMPLPLFALQGKKSDPGRAAPAGRSICGPSIAIRWPGRRFRVA
jgi:hypothetical protein